jgi:hypothetical protein
MPRKAAVENNSFVKGLVTEASPLTFPEGTASAISNMELNRDGSLSRRFGMDVESGGSYTSTSLSSLTNTAVRTYKWKNAGNEATTAFMVVQVGRKLYFFDGLADTISDNLTGSITVTGASDADLMSFAYIQGDLVVAALNMSAPVRISWDGTSFSQEQINIKVRDIWGIDDGLAVDERPTTLSVAHDYNLRNQGWPHTFTINTAGRDNSTFTETTETDPVNYTNGRFGWFPSNADIIWANLTETADEAHVLRSYWPFNLERQLLGTTPAAKGKFIIDAFSRSGSRKTESDVAGSIPADAELGKISVVESYSGRIWYSGVLSVISGGDDRSPSYSGMLFFTQIIENDDAFEKCYQEADPTSEDFSELVATDGGTVRIPEAGFIVDLRVIGNQLVVLSENGVWSISGTDGGFRADDYRITKISDVGVVGKQSIVNVESGIMYWAEGGIYALTPDQISGTLNAQNITENVIQTLYEDINSIARTTATGFYDKLERKVKWLYNNDSDYDGVTLPYSYNKELILDTVLSAWYVNDIVDADSDSPFLSGYSQTEGFTTTTVNNLVESSDIQVIVKLPDDYSYESIAAEDWEESSSTFPSGSSQSYDSGPWVATGASAGDGMYIWDEGSTLNGGSWNPPDIDVEHWQMKKPATTPTYISTITTDVDGGLPGGIIPEGVTGQGSWYQGNIGYSYYFEPCRAFVSDKGAFCYRLLREDSSEIVSKYVLVYPDGSGGGSPDTLVNEALTNCHQTDKVFDDASNLANIYGSATNYFIACQKDGFFYVFLFGSGNQSHYITIQKYNMSTGDLVLERQEVNTDFADTSGLDYTSVALAEKCGVVDGKLVVLLDTRNGTSRYAVEIFDVSDLSITDSQWVDDGSWFTEMNVSAPEEIAFDPGNEDDEADSRIVFESAGSQYDTAWIDNLTSPTGTIEGTDFSSGIVPFTTSRIHKAFLVEKDQPIQMPILYYNRDTSGASSSALAWDLLQPGDVISTVDRDVLLTEAARTSGTTQTKYLVVKPNAVGSNYGISFGHYYNTDFQDWSDNDAAAYIVTGASTYGDTQRQKRLGQIFMHFVPTETSYTTASGFENQSGCLLRGRWGWANSSDRGKWSEQKQAYRLRNAFIPDTDTDPYSYGFDVVTTQNRVRGSGKALALRMDSEAGKDMQILGWAYLVEVEDNP